MTGDDLRLGAAGGGGVLPFLTLAELLAKVDAAGPRRYLIRGVWPAGAYGVHAAPAKAQKTWTLDDLAVSVASGTPWLGHFPIDTPGAVVMFRGESGEAVTARRIRAICADRGVDAAALPIVVCMRAPHLTDDEHMAEFARKVATVHPVLVTLDPLYLSAGSANSKSLYEMGSVLERPQLACDDVGSALLLAHHYNRGAGTGADRFSGAGPSEWGRVLIGADVKSRHTDPDTQATTVVTAFEVIGGEIPDQAWRVKRTIWADDPDDLDSPLHYTVTVLTGEDTGDTGDAMPPARRKLLEAVSAIGGDGGAPSTQLVDWIADKYGHGLYRTTVSEHLNAARKDGLVDSVESPGRPTLWFPAEGVGGVVPTPRRHPATGDAGGVSSSSSRIGDDDTPTPHDTTPDVSAESGRTEDPEETVLGLLNGGVVGEEVAQND